MMPIIFTHNPAKEYDNFHRSFASLNHAEPSPRQREFFAQYTELTPENAQRFAASTLRSLNIDVSSALRSIERSWRAIEQEFFRRADAVFRTHLPIETITAYLTVHDRCSYNFLKQEFFVRLYRPSANSTIMHELWHWYLYFTVGKGIQTQHGRATFNAVKESLTVLLNELFPDLLEGATDKGYPQHQALRAHILTAYRDTHDVYQTIDRALEQCAEPSTGTTGSSEAQHPPASPP